MQSARGYPTSQDVRTGPKACRMDWVHVARRGHGLVKRLRKGVSPSILQDVVGLWRSLVARYLGVVEVVGSNPASPTRLDARYGRFLDNAARRLAGPFSWMCAKMCESALPLAAKMACRFGYAAFWCSGFSGRLRRPRPARRQCRRSRCARFLHPQAHDPTRAGFDSDRERDHTGVCQNPRRFNRTDTS